jgi:hypothetical protein
MLNTKKFTVSIGEYGIIVALHNHKDVQNKILVAALTDENKPQLKELFSKNSTAPVYILIDTIDQNYKKKTYPPVTKSDFNKMVKRDFTKEIDHVIKSFQNYYGVRDKINKKWECVFVSTNYSPEIEKWIEFLLGMPNDLVGIYMLPIETNVLATSIFDVIKTEHDIKINENTVLSFIVQNKISGVRQVVFSGQSIVFTRVVNYNFEDPQFAEHFEQDVFRANEYLKMIFPKLKAQDVIVVNILSEEVIKKIENTAANRDLTFINYSPSAIAGKLGITNATSKNSGNFSDIIIANQFANNPKKLLKFTTRPIVILGRLYLAIKSLLFTNLAMAAAVFLILFITIGTQYQSDNKISQLNKEKLRLQQQLQSINNAALEGGDKKDDNLANEIIDFGKIDEVLSKTEVNITSVFNRLAMIRKQNASATAFSYNIPEYNPKAEVFLINKASFHVSGDIYDQSGDIEALFRKFDNLNLDTKNKFPEFNIKYSEIPKNIDFSKKYYSFPFDLTIENK